MERNNYDRYPVIRPTTAINKLMALEYLSRVPIRKLVDAK